MTRLKAFLFSLVFLGATVGVYTTTALGGGGDKGDNGHKFVYSAKFLCGNNTDPGAPVNTGRYESAINLHNPNTKTVVFLKKGILTYPQSDAARFEPQEPPEVFDPGATLDPNWGMEVDCRDIRQGLKEPTTPFIKGWVVVESPKKLDVVAAYTGQGQVTGGGTQCSGVTCTRLEGFSEHLETVKPTVRGDDDDDNGDD